MQRIRVEMSDQEFEALAKLSELELRPLSDQVRAIVRERLAKDGLLPRHQRECTPCAS